MNFINKVLENKKYVHRLTISFLTFVFFMVSFLVINLIKMYNNTIKPMDEVKLIYDFGPNTLKYESFNDHSLNSDISEQFLSYSVSYGVDVSEWQGYIDWDKVKATGISFAMIRCGFRQIEGNEIIEDATFRQNVEGAIKAGLKVGVYFYGTAKNEAEAIEEAEFTINLIKDYNISYPVVYDAETFNSGRLKNISYSTITDNILTYTETIASYGYDTMIYSYKDALSYYLDMGKLEGKLVWLAHWVEKTNYKGNYNMWQYTDSGRVDGIKTAVDLNVSYFNYVEDESKIVEIPNNAIVPEVEFREVNETISTYQNITMRTSPCDTIPNKFGTIPKNTTLVRTGISEEFSRVIYGGKTVYIYNKYFKVLS